MLLLLHGKAANTCERTSPIRPARYLGSLSTQQPRLLRRPPTSTAHRPTACAVPLPTVTLAVMVTRPRAAFPIRRLRPCRAPACLSQSSPADAVVGPPPASAARRNHTVLLGSTPINEHPHWPPASTLRPKKRHFAITRDGRSTIGWVRRMMRPRDSQHQPGSPQGVCVHAKPNRDCDRPQSAQQVVPSARLTQPRPSSPGQLACRAELSLAPPRVAVRSTATT